MGSKKSSRRKRAESRLPRIKAALSALGPGIVIKDGRELLPGTREYESQLMLLATHLSEEELSDLEARSAKGS